MFLLYPILAGLALGLLLGGRLENLETATFRWAPLAVLGLAVQIVLFSPWVTPSIGAAGPPLYVASTALVALVAARNARRPGIALVALGASLNLLAIVANSGSMPADAGALAALGRGVGEGYSNSVVAGSGVAIWPLTDIFAMPRGLPGANVFSVGDVLIGAGALVWLVVTLRRTAPPGDAAQPPEPGALDPRPPSRS